MDTPYVLTHHELCQSTTINLSISDPWLEEIIWPVTKDTVIFCLHPIPNGGFPVISSLEIRPMPKEAYSSNWRDPPFNSLKKRFRINCGVNNGFLRYKVITNFSCVIFELHLLIA